MARKTRYHLDNVSGGGMELAPKHLTKQEFGRRVYRLMLEKGWNQSELARQAGITRDGVSTYVRGVSLPTPDNLKKLAAALGKNPEDLLPNYVEGAIDADHPAIEMKVSPNRPSEAWLRVNRAVTVDTAIEVMRIINADKLGKKD